MAWNASTLRADVLAEFSELQERFLEYLDAKFYLRVRRLKQQCQARYRYRHSDREKARHRRSYQQLRANPEKWAEELRRHRESRLRNPKAKVVTIRHCPICRKMHCRALSEFCSDKCRQSAYYRANKKRWTEGYSPVTFKRPCPNCEQMGHNRKTCPLVIVRDKQP